MRCDSFLKYLPGLLALLFIAPAAAQTPRHGLDLPGGSAGNVGDAVIITPKSGRPARILGDILVPADTPPELFGALRGNKWPQATLSYSFDGSVTTAQRTMFRDFVLQWENSTGMRFVENASASNRVLVQTATGIGCGSSYVGMIGGVQDLLIGCWTARTVLHEVGHAFGLIHEQQRTDRNSYVSIIDHGIVAQCGSGTWNANFGTQSTNAASAYDYASIMHYANGYEGGQCVYGYNCNGQFVCAEIRALGAQPPGSPSGSEAACSDAASCTALLGAGTISPRDSHGTALRYGYRIQVSASGAGTVSVSGQIEGCGTGCYLVSPAALFTVTATPAVGYVAEFSGSYCSGTQAQTCGFYPWANGSVQVRFARPSTTTMSVSPSPSVFGQSISVHYAVTSAYGTPTGDVEIDLGLGWLWFFDVCTAPVSQGSCTIDLAGYMTYVGQASVSVRYLGDTIHAGSSSGVTHTVNKGDAHVTVSTDPSTVVSGQTFTVTGSVSPAPPAAGYPSGTVVFSAAGQTCSADTISSQASCSLTATHAGPLVIEAAYGGDARFNAANGTLAIDIERALTSLSIVADAPDPSEIGQAYEVATQLAVVAPGGGTPGGMVTVSDGIDSCGVVAPATSCWLVSSTPGDKTLLATYSGDADFAGAVSAGEPHAVTRHPSASAITAVTPSPSVVGQTVDVAFAVTAAAGAPSGTVMIAASSGESCATTVEAGSCPLTFANAGDRTLTVNYAGDASFLPSSGTASHGVQKGGVNVSLDVTPASTVSGESFLASVTVVATPPAAGVPGGIVTVSADGASCTATLSGGAGSCSLAVATPGVVSVVADYGGEANFNAGSDSASHTVSKGDVVVSVGTAPATSVVGQPFAATATVSAAAPATGTPGGSVTISAAGANCTATLADGVATCELAAPHAGTVTVAASYAGDARFNPGTGEGTQTVEQAATTLAIRSDQPDPSLPGEAVTVTVDLDVSAPGSGAPTGTITIGGSSDSCTISLPETDCALVLTQSGMRTLTASYPGDADFGASSASAGHLVLASADLGISIDDGRDFVALGAVVAYDIEATNHGPNDALGARVVDFVPASLADALWTCTAIAGGTCGESQGEGDIDLLVDLPVGAGVRLVLTAVAVGDEFDEITHSVVISGPADTFDAQPANDGATDVDTVVLFRDGFENEARARR